MSKPHLRPRDVDQEAREEPVIEVEALSAVNARPYRRSTHARGAGSRQDPRETLRRRGRRRQEHIDLLHLLRLHTMLS